jgi:hypothetical protein
MLQTLPSPQIMLRVHWGQTGRDTDRSLRNDEDRRLTPAPLSRRSSCENTYL